MGLFFKSSGSWILIPSSLSLSLFSYPFLPLFPAPFSQPLSPALTAAGALVSGTVPAPGKACFVSGYRNIFWTTLQSQCTLPCHGQEGRGRSPKQSSLRSRNNNGCTEVLPKLPIWSLWADLEKTAFPFLHILGLGRMKPKEKQHEDFIAFMLLGKKCSPKQFSVLGECHQ